MKGAGEADKLEMYNLKHRECQVRFKEYTTDTKMLSTVFDADDDIDVTTKRFMKKFHGCIAVNFKKVRIGRTKPDKGVDLHSRFQELKDKEGDLSKKEKDKVLKDIIKEANSNYTKLKEEINRLKSNEGGLNEKLIWKLKKKLCPRSNDPPSAMLDGKGNIITCAKAIEKLSAEVYKKRLEGNTIVENLAGLEKDINKLCMNRLNLCKQKKLDPLDISDLKEVLKN